MILSIFRDHLAVRHNNEEDIVIEWEDIHTVYYYQIDCIESVLGYLAFDLTYGETIEINDSVEYWEQILDDLEQYLPNQTMNWRAALHNWTIHENELLIYQQE